MPTTLVGLVVFLAFLTPGFLHYIQRRALVPEGPLSPLVETATLTTVSLVTNLAALGVFGLIRFLLPDHTPDIGKLLVPKSTYVRDYPAYILAWSVGVLALSSSLAVILARYESVRRAITARFTPVIFDVSSWYYLFEQAPSDSFVYVGCLLRDGSYVGGRVDWYSTETKETGDRELVLAPPLVQQQGDDTSELSGVERLIVAARDIVTLRVAFVHEETATPGSD